MTKPKDDRMRGEARQDVAVGNGSHVQRPVPSALWAVSMGWELVVPIGAGAVVGHLLHQRYHTGVVVTLVLLLLGVVVGYYNLLRLIRRATKRNDYQAQHNRGGAL